MKNFNIPEVEIIAIEISDIITTSPNSGVNEGEGGSNDTPIL